MKAKTCGLLFSVLLLALSAGAQTIDGRLYTRFNNWYLWRGGAFDSTLLLPQVQANAGLRAGALRYNAADTSVYVYNGSGWVKISGTGEGGGSIDTTSLSNRINQKLNISDTAAMLAPYLRSNVAAATYQPLLISGSNIKTINGNSLLGSGDILISGSNIYNSNGTLTGNRQLTLGGNSLSVLSGSNTAFHLFPNGRAWFGSGTPVDAGLQLDVNGTARVNGHLNTGVIQFLLNSQLLRVDNDNFIQLPRLGGFVNGVFSSNGGLGWSFRDNGINYSILSAGNGTTTSCSFFINEINAPFGVNAISFLSDLSLRSGAQSAGESLMMIIPNFNRAAPAYSYRPSLIVQAGRSGTWVGADNFAPAGHLYLRGGDANNTGTNVSGGNVYVQSGRGTGTGTGGDIIIQTSNAAPSGTTIHTLEERVRIKFNTGNVLIGTNTDVASSILTLASTTKGFLPPRMTGAEAEAIPSPAEGLMVYVTNGNGTTITSKGWWGYEGTTWVKLN